MSIDFRNVFEKICVFALFLYPVNVEIDSLQKKSENHFITKKLCILIMEIH